MPPIHVFKIQILEATSITIDAKSLKIVLRDIFLQAPQMILRHTKLWQLLSDSQWLTVKWGRKNIGKTSGIAHSCIHYGKVVLLGLTKTTILSVIIAYNRYKLLRTYHQSGILLNPSSLPLSQLKRAPFIDLSSSFISFIPLNALKNLMKVAYHFPDEKIVAQKS